MAATSYTGSSPVELTDAQLANYARMLAQNLPVSPAYIADAVALWERKGGDGSVILQAGKARFVSDADDDLPGRGVARAATALPGGVPRGILPTIPSPNRPSKAEDPMSIEDNYVWVHGVQGTSTQSAEVKPTDPIKLSDVELDSDDATARVTSIKQGSRELLGYTGYGLRCSAFTRSGTIRRLFKGLIISKNDPLNVSLVHAGSGTNTTTITLIGESIGPAACAR